jgi:hypothetical protein
LRIDEIDKPGGKWCEHCEIGVGCKVYADRPSQCANFYCGFLTVANLAEEWRPSKCKIVLVEEPGVRLGVHVDPGRPSAWKSEPFYSHLKQEAANRLKATQQVVVYMGNHVTVILPDRDVDLGLVGEDEVIITHGVGTRLEAVKMNKNDPRLKAHSF